MGKKLFAFGFAAFFVVNCAYKPVGVISRVSEGQYSTTTYGNDENEAMSRANADAKGICKDKHKNEYFKIVSTQTENLNAKTETGSGFAGAATSMLKMGLDRDKNNNKVVLTFDCN